MSNDEDIQGRNRKNLIIVMAVVGGLLGLSLCACLGFGILGAGWFASNMDDFTQGGERGRVAGEQFGRTTDQDGCVEETIGRMRACGPLGLACQMSAQMFSLTCLRAAQPVAGFCDGVPSGMDIAGSVQFRTVFCAEHGMRPNEQQTCQQTAGGIQAYCEHSAAPTPGPPNTP